MNNNKRVYRIKHFVTAKVVIVGTSISIECWLSPVNVWGNFEPAYPHKNAVEIEGEEIVIQSNVEITDSMSYAKAEYSNSIINEQRAINKKRKLANR